MKIDRKAGKRYLTIHLILVGAVLLFPLYQMITSHLPRHYMTCFLHDRLFLYCPACGGTRAIQSLLQLDLLSALRYNAFLVILLLLLLGVDILCLIRLLRGKSKLVCLPGWVWITLVTAMLLYAILRNYLMIAHGYDPVGDLGNVWERIIQRS